MSKDLTPMMRQYMEVKNEYSDCIIFYRLGDFYEMFFEDAEFTSKILDLALTKRECGNGKKAPMCGIPYHVLNQYLYKLVSSGKKVAICEQVQDPKLAKGIVKREVIKIVTPGTIDEFDEISATKNNYILSLYIDSNNMGLTYSDISTSEIFSTSLLNVSKLDLINAFEEEVIKLNPSEVIINKNILKNMENPIVKILNTLGIMYTKVENDEMSLSIAENNPEFLAENRSDFAMLNSVNNFYNYVCKFGIRLNDFKKIKIYNINNYLRIDANSRINLELKKNNFSGNIKGSLLNVINYTNTPMGFRLLNKWIDQPLLDVNKIKNRQDFVEEFLENTKLRSDVEGIFSGISDIERINSKISFGNCNGRDLINLKNSLVNIPKLKKLLENTNALKTLVEEIPNVENIHELIESSIIEDVGISLREGNLIKVGYDAELDKIRNDKILGKERLISYEIEQKNSTGIKNLRLVFNKKTGYFFEVTKSYQSLVPDYFDLKQTLTNANRYKSRELEEIEGMIFGSESDIVDKEYEIFTKIRNTINLQIKNLQRLSDILSFIDCIYSLSVVAYKNNYCKPQINTDKIIEVRNGRHAVIEEILPSLNDFISNDIKIGEENNLIQIITGPNMSGKSTYIRQIALIVILAQIGSFVPAEYANISIVDRIFTRIGASDNLYKGESTFMVEMKEVNNILRYSTDRSLLILDEVGRGTSTFDGLSLAWAIVEFIIKNIKAKTLFATHYHELIDLSDIYPNITNKHISVYEDKENDDIVFLRKIKDGGANKSYGIAVAKLAGLPVEVITRANEILQNIENKDIEIQKNLYNSDSSEVKKENNDIIKILNNIRIEQVSPIEALNILNDLINMVDK